MPSILFYVSGHGFGHAVRMSEVILDLKRLRPDWRVLVRSQVPRPMLPDNVESYYAEIDPGVVEKQAGVVMDEAATLLRLQAFLGRWDEIVERESAFVREQNVNLIVADIPAVAGDIAQATGLPCVAISNFTWDWIYELYASGYLERLEHGYAGMSVLLRLPFYQPSRLDVFPAIIDTPLIARKHADLRRPGKTRVLLGSRAEVSVEALEKARREASEFELLTPGPEMRFTDAFAACDLVIAKLGFSMLAECIAARKAILYPPRENFREEALLQQNVDLHVAAASIPLADFYSGNWAPFLRDLAGRPAIASDVRTDGAEFCARFLANFP